MWWGGGKIIHGSTPLFPTCFALHTHTCLSTKWLSNSSLSLSPYPFILFSSSRFITAQSVEWSSHHKRKRGGGGWIPLTSMNIAAAAASAIILAALATVFPFPPFIRPRWGFIREAKGVGGGFKRSPPMFVSFFYVRGEVLERFLNLSLFVKNRWKLNRQ